MKIFHAVTILGLSSASPIDFLSTSTQFVLGKDYEVECRPDGIMLTSTTGQFLLTDRAEDADKHCKEVSHWNKYGGSMFIPDCLAIKESTKIWNGVIITRKEQTRKWSSATIYPECYFTSAADNEV